jgi:pyruvate dehydrogenase E2 component (dihydrolipoamide acetyltransferase)
MARVLRMPGISADAEEVVFLEWCASPGNRVSVGDAIATVETEKANVDIESDQEAVLWRTLIAPGDCVAVGSPIAVLVGVDEVVDDESRLMASLGLTDAKNGLTAPDAVPAQQQAEPIQPAKDDGHTAQLVSNDRVFSSPIARKIARDNGIVIEQVVGTGPGSRIIRADIERVIAQGSSPADRTEASPPEAHDAGAGFTDIPHSGLRRAIARSLTASKQSAPHFYLDATCRVDELLELRRSINEHGSTKVSINDFVIKAVAKALIDVPDMNVIWMDDCVRHFDSADVSVAIGSSSGLVTPVLRSADRSTLSEISDQMKDFANRANEGRLKQHELEGGSFSISNLGMFGVEGFTAILNPPQAGILAVGAITEAPVVREGAIEVANVMRVTVSADHRPVDGVVAARWLQRFRELIEHPALMLI